MTDAQWKVVNKELSEERARWVQSQFEGMLSNSVIQAASSTSKGCDELYYIGNGRSLEIKAWIR